MGNSRYFPGNKDTLGKPRRFAEKIDIGAYEYLTQIFYVSQTATGNNDGSSWENAFTSLQTALNVTQSGDELWLKSGVHRTPNLEGFIIDNPVNIYGGFIGTETRREQRSPIFNRTVLSADIDANDTVDNGTTLAVSDQIGTNSKRVILISILDIKPYYHTPTSIDGLFISGAAGTVSGGGIAHTSQVSDLILTSVSFAGNSATYGAGINSEGNLTARGCVLFQCKADQYGGGLSCGNPGSFDSRITIENCVFTNNTAALAAGGINCTDGILNVSGTSFSGNSAGTSGGAVKFANQISNFTNCTFTNNTAVKEVRLR